jgi:alkanesulfonate monooxygenase SsuD/methylene tetrahydromethanopterin reductase-like flavin-dependent oxidoreductase (luciferase family)
MAGFVKEGESAGNRKVDRASYMMTSMDPDLKTARDTVKKFYFFLYQLSDVLPPNALEKYGVTEEQLKPMKEAWKKGDVAEASRLVPEEAVDALTIVGTPDKALARVSEYMKVGVDLPIIMPIGNTAYAMESLAPGERLPA